VLYCGRPPPHSSTEFCLTFTIVPYTFFPPPLSCPFLPIISARRKMAFPGSIDSLVGPPKFVQIPTKCLSRGMTSPFRLFCLLHRPVLVHDHPLKPLCVNILEDLFLAHSMELLRFTILSFDLARILSSKAFLALFPSTHRPVGFLPPFCFLSARFLHLEPIFFLQADCRPGALALGPVRPMSARS